MKDIVKTVFRHERENGGHWYSASFGHKDKETGEYKPNYIPLQFAQGTEIPDRAKIMITDMTIDFYDKRDGSRQVVIKVWAFQPAPQQPVQYPQNYVQQQFQAPGYMAQGYQQGYQQEYQQPAVGYVQAPKPIPTAPKDSFETINEEVPF